MNVNHLKKVIILQNLVPHYRKPVYNALGKQFDVTLLHSGKHTVKEGDNYKEIIVPCKRVSKFYVQSNVYKTLRKNNYDVIIAMFDLAWINYMMLNFFYLKKIIYWGHRYSQNTMANMVRNFIMKRCKAVVLYSEVEVEEMMRVGIKKEQIFIAHNTMLISNHGDCSHEEKDRFIFVGRAQKRKRVDMLIDSFSRILERIPEHINLYIIGAGKENELLKKQIEELRLQDRVIFTGAIHDDEALKEYFKKSFAYVSPGPVGLGVLHSFAYGVPTITMNYGKHGPEYQNIEDGVNGLVFSTEEELDVILLKLIQDKKGTQMMGANAYLHYSENRSVKVMVKGLVDAINYEVIKRN